MKNLVVLLILVFSVSFLFAQNAKRTSAYNYLRNGKLDKAMEYIEPTITHEKTMNDPKTWFYRGTIYLQIAASDNPEYKDLAPNALDIAHESFLRAKELDEKEEYMAEITQNMRVIAEQFYNEGVGDYNNKDFKGAADAFEKAFRINSEVGRVDSTALFNAALSAQIAKDYDMAKRLFHELDEMGFKQPGLYSALSQVYQIEGDTAKAIAIMKKGREVFPNNFELLIEETNIYLAQGDVENALANLETAIKMDTTNPNIYFAVGANYDQIGRFDDAEEAYKKAINLNPEYFDAYYNLGALYVNRAAEIQAEANDLPLDEVEKYNEMKAKADDYLKKSLPYLEKALEINPGDKNTLYSLKEIYTRLNMPDKLKEVNEKLK